MHQLELRNITKTFGNVVANNNVSLTLEKGEILSLLGENGCGKTTLMNMIAGIYYPDSGSILINDEEVKIKSPMDAFKYGIGMVHQHYMLVDVFTAAENIILGYKEEGKFDIKKSSARIKEIADKYGFNIDPKKKIYDMSVSEKQTVEIVKVLFRGADILILDEPTAVLTPQEIKKLFNILRKMKEDGKSIIIITHKLNEVLEISDRVAVLRKGEYIGCVKSSETNESQLTEMMVGKKVELNIERTEPHDCQDRLIISNLNTVREDGLPGVQNINFTARSGEILGIAGIAGSGQKELLEAIAGLSKIKDGKIEYLNPDNQELVNLREKNPKQIRNLGVRLAFVPEDRLGMGLVGNMDLVDNVMLRSYEKGKLTLLDRKTPGKLTQEIVQELEVVTDSVHTPVRRLSGGNVQKILVGREIASVPKVLMAAYPVRGLDINSSYLIYNLLNKEKNSGVAVIFVGEDLDVLLALSDRILVLNGGHITGIVDARTTTKEEVGFLMTKTVTTHEEE